MYAHGQATIVLCEAFLMTGDEQLREPAQRAVNFIVQAQHPAGGWRYRPGEAGDTSVLGWQLMALQSARAASLEVAPESFALADHFLDTVQHQNGALYAYQRGRPATDPHLSPVSPTFRWVRASPLQVRSRTQGITTPSTDCRRRGAGHARKP